MAPKGTLELHVIFAIWRHDTIVFVLNTLFEEMKFLRAIVLTDYFYHIVEIVSNSNCICREPLIIIILLNFNFDATFTFSFDDAHVSSCLVERLFDNRHSK